MIPSRLDATDARGIALFGDALATAGYEAAGIKAALQAEGDGLTPSPAQVPVLLRLLPPGAALTALVTLFLFRIPIARAAAERALAPLTVDHAAALGLVTAGADSVEANVRIIPYADWLFACDRAPESAPDLRADHVIGVTGSSMLLAELTPRARAGAALDVGCGSGIQAVMLARHADHVVATDVNPRALNFTAFNARLNGTTNVTVREGSLFEPVLAEQFDLIVSNPPFVISPENRLAFRDSGMRGDAISREIVRGAYEHLRDGGMAIVLVSWMAPLEEPWSSALRRWTEDLDGDRWFLHYATDTPLAHAANWLQPLQPLDPAAHAAALDAWTRYYDELAVEAIGYGVAIVRRRDGARRWTRIDDLGAERPTEAGDQLVALARAQDFISGLDGDGALLQAVLASEPRHQLDQALRCVDGAFDVERAALRLEHGLRFQLPVSALAAQLFARLDGKRSLAEAIALAAQAVGDQHASSLDLERAALASARRLIELGFAHVVAPGLSDSGPPASFAPS